MTAHAQDPYRMGRSGAGDDNTGRGEGGPASKRTTVGYGFWIYLLSDIILFSGFFAAYAVLAKQTAGGPSPHDLFGQERVALETAALLLSSFTCGLAGVAAEKRKLVPAQLWLLATGLLGAVFLALELTEFAEMIGNGAGPQRSAFLSAFYGLVGLHGLHIAVGLLWLGTMMAQLWVNGFRPQVLRRLMCFNLFWHALDIVWVGIFTMVYLMGVAP
ncbi:cytochrome o ubiquinol oxidase subunit III [Sphingomonas sp. TDK1]|uniref:cytochrome o ubiquinol oxidase subunit III n=1 Tax=Sphingomonas sp. TDK1 TaxID=453247 RepID=UPI0007D980AE|nr:cytochrome o ubiquinol oxidase subunit III [Sphingomonas sp. TDK1]OAN66351.1 cytochrome o ubiquinol oxidase subunit III [Sphingomonas sp. TDK1]